MPKQLRRPATDLLLGRQPLIAHGCAGQWRVAVAVARHFGRFSRASQMALCKSYASEHLKLPFPIATTADATNVSIVAPQRMFILDA